MPKQIFKKIIYIFLSIISIVFFSKKKKKREEKQIYSILVVDFRLIGDMFLTGYALSVVCSSQDMDSMKQGIVKSLEMISLKKYPENVITSLYSGIKTH